MNFIEKNQLKHEFKDSERAAKLKRYKDDSSNQEVLTLSHERILGGSFKEKIKKQSLALKGDESLDILTNQNLNHDTCILLHTTGKSLQSMLRKGQLNPQALTAKIIKAVGKYNKKCADREIKSRIKSVLHVEKKILTDMAQDRIESLQEIERFIGHRIHQPDLVSLQLLKALEDYCKQQEAYLTKIKTEGQYAGCDFSVADLENRLKADQAAAEKLKTQVRENGNKAEWLQTLGYEALLSFIKGRSVAILRQTQALNQILTHRRYSGAFLRGDLNGFLEDAVKLTRDHVQDFHNPMTEDHQLAYAPDKKITIDTDYHTDGSREALEDFMLVVSEVSGDNKPLEEKKSKGPISLTSATKWKHFRSFYDGSNPYGEPFFRSTKHVFGTLANWLLAPFNLIETMLRGSEAGFFAGLCYVPEKNKKVVDGKTDYYALIYRVNEHTRLSTKIGLSIHKVFSYLFWEGLILGGYDGVKQILRLPIDFMTDLRNQDRSPAELLKSLSKELKQIQQEKNDVLKDLNLNTEEEKPREEIYYAEPKIPLTPYHSHGVLNSGVDGFISFVDLFGHNMFAKHPVTALLSSSGAAASFAAFFAGSSAVSFMGKGYVDFLLGQGHLWTKNVVSASLAGSFTNFKLIGLIFEGIEHGPDSWLVKGVSLIINDPATAITYSTLSWMMGHAMLYQIEIPGLSEELRAQLGDLPELTAAFGGAKVLIFGHHLLASPKEPLQALCKNYVTTSVALYKEMQARNGVVVTPEEEAVFKASMDKLVNPEQMKNLGNELANQLSQLSKEEKDKLALMMTMAVHRKQLEYLTPLLKAQLKPQLLALTGSKTDAGAVEKWLDPDKYKRQSTLRGFIGGIVGYIPVLTRSLLSPLTGLVAGSLSSALRPWKELHTMLLDDVTSTTHAVLNFTHKVLETLFNRLPRTLADIVVNDLVARTASFFGYHKITTGGYQLSAGWDITQEQLCSNTTGKLLNRLAYANTTPHPEVGLQNGIEARMTTNFSKPAAGFFESNRVKPVAPPAQELRESNAVLQPPAAVN